MPKCTPIRRKKRQPCIGDMDNEINIQTRALTGGMGANASVGFTTRVTLWSLVQTERGTVVIDEANTERSVTHSFIVNAQDAGNVDVREWVLFDSQRYDILDVEDYDERGEYLALRCALTGSTTRAASDA